MRKRCVLYARVSTKKERGLQDPENQLRQLRTFASSQGWDLTAEYIDRESGTKTDRKQFSAMFDSAAKRHFDILLFWSLDRFSRGGIVPTLTDLKRLDAYGVHYRSYQEAYIDTTSPFGDLLAAFVAKIAELERERIVERINAGLDRARAEGKTLGRKRLVFDRQRVLDLRGQGQTISAISAALGLSHGTVQRVLEAKTERHRNVVG